MLDKLRKSQTTKPSLNLVERVIFESSFLTCSLGLGPTFQPASHDYDLDPHNANSFRQLHSSDNDSAISERLSSHVATSYSQIVGPILESLFPRAIIDVKPSARCTGSSECQQYSLDYLRLLTYAAANNLAGVQGLVSLPMMFEYLRPMMLSPHSQEVHALVKVASFPSAGPMAETFFRCAIEAGDVSAVGSLCCSTEIELNANDQVCVSNGTRYTPVERAAALHHLALTRFLETWASMLTKCTKTYSSSVGVGAKYQTRVQ
jgi:hypothetical protein